MKRTWFRRVRAARPKSSRSPRTNRLWLELLENRNAPGSMLTGPMGSVDPSLGSAAAPATSDLAVAPTDAATAQPSLPADSTLGTIGLDSSGQALPAFQTVVDPAATQPQSQPAAPTPQADTPPAPPSDPFSLPALPGLGDINSLDTPPPATAQSLSSNSSSAASSPTPAADAPPPGSPDVAAGSWSPPAPYAWQPSYDSGGWSLRTMAQLHLMHHRRTRQRLRRHKAARLRRLPPHRLRPAVHLRPGREQERR